MNHKQGKRTSKVISAILLLALLSSLGLSIHFWMSWQNAEATKQAGVEAISNLLMENQSLGEQLSSLQTSLSDRQSEYEGLMQQREQLVQEVDQAEAEIDNLRSQKYYLADVLDWYNLQFLYPRYPLNCLDITFPCTTQIGARDVGEMANTYAAETGNPIPQNCEFASSDRFLRWASLQSRMYEVTPEKMGWTPYYSVFTNILFGPDHRPDLPGYVGSLGYELRYPVVPGTWPLQELHTTINVYSSDPNIKVKDGAAETVELDCGVQGNIFLGADADETKVIFFNFGTVDANVKLKYFHNDLAEALPILTQAANIVINDFTLGW